MKKISEYAKLQREIRKQSKMSIRELSQEAGVSHSYLSQVENGTRSTPSAEVIKKIAGALNYDYFALMRAAGYMDSELNLGQLVKRKRDSQGVSLENFAEKIDLPVSKVTEIESGELIPTPDTLFKISEVLKVEFSDLMKKAGFWNGDGEFVDLFDRIEQSKNWEIVFKVPMHETIIDEEDGVESTYLIPKEEALNRFLSLESLMTSHHSIYFNSKKLTDYQRKQLLKIAEIIFTPSEEKE